MRTRRAVQVVWTGALLLFVNLLSAPSVSAQVGATTGAIIGAVTDNSQALVPGVTVTASGPAMMGTRIVVTGAEGEYRIPAIPPGVYKLVFELPGFATVQREGIQITLGFTATINVELHPAGVGENITVQGGTPVVDLASTQVTTSFSGDRLAALSGTRDYAAIMAQLPAVSMNRPSVGGSGAITFQRTTKYGLQGHDRGEIEGIVSTQNSQGGTEVSYSDSDSFAEVSVNVLGNGAETPQPGTFTKVIAKSGSNTYRGRVYADYQHGALQAHNIDDAQIEAGLVAPGTVAIRDLNRLEEFRDFSADVGGFLVKDRLWWYAAYRYQRLEQNEVNLIDGTHELWLPVTTVKVDYSPKTNHKLTGYWFKGTKNQNVSILGDLTDTALVTMDALNTQEFGTGVGKIEYSAVLSSSTMFEIRGGNYFIPSVTQARSDKVRYEDPGAARVYGATASTIKPGRNDRPQVNGSLTYFKSGWVGTHNFKVGGEYFHQISKGALQTRVDNVVLYLNNGAPSQVRIFEPPVESKTGVSVLGTYLQDTWMVRPRLTFNLGLRVERTLSYVPEQTGLGGRKFARVEAPIWIDWGPRLGAVYALTDDLKTLLKASWGRYSIYPYTTISGAINPNPSSSSSLYTWTPQNPQYDEEGFPIYVPGQEGRLLSVSGARPDGTSATRVDPNLKNGGSIQTSVYFEREVAPDFGVRTGFVWNGWRNINGQVFANWPLDGFTVPVTLIDPGRDGRLGTPDDGGPIQAFDLDPSFLSQPRDQVIQNLSNQDSDYYTWEVTANKRQTGRWSLLASFTTTWSRQAVVPLHGAQNSDRGFQEHNLNTIMINTHNGRDHFTNWVAKATSTIDLGWGVRVTPLIQYQSGRPFARTFLAPMNFNSAVYIRAEPVGAQRAPSLTVAHVRTEKFFRLHTRGSRLGVFFDLYNIVNTNTTQEFVTSSGSGYGRPNVITTPRIVRFGLKLDL